MKIGTLWFDNDPKKDFATKCAGAIEFYKIKYGRSPTAIYVHPATTICEIPGVAIHTSRSVLVNHFWIGMEEQNEK